jgi:hypothetical protein
VPFTRWRRNKIRAIKKHRIATQSAIDDKLKLTFNLNSGATDAVNSIGRIGELHLLPNLITNAYVMRPTDPSFITQMEVILRTQIYFNT